MKKLFWIFCVLIFIIFPLSAKAEQSSVLTDWVIRDFSSQIEVRQDSSAKITEMITADCANLPDKHGIFRVLPTKIKVDNGTTITTPIKLLSITDFNNQPYTYSSSRDNFSNTLSWKIGDPNITVIGVNNYKIVYEVSNVIRPQNNYDEFYWNLSGNNWQIPIEKFSATITFPENAKINSSKISLYAGVSGNKSQGDSSYKILSANQISISNPEIINPGEGVTLSTSFPSGTFTPYKPGFWEAYRIYFYWIIPLFILIMYLFLWQKYSRDPKINKSIVPEFDIPSNLDPITMGSIDTQSGLGRNSIAAAIINFAVKKIIIIKEIPKSGIFGSKNYQFNDISNIQSKNKLSKIEKELYDDIFLDQKEITLSDIKDRLKITYFDLQKSAKEELVSQGFLTKQSGKIMGINSWFWIMIHFAIIVVFSIFAWVDGINLNLIIVAIVSILIFIIFLILSPKYTPLGAELNYKIDGFKLFIKTAEKYRAQFQEKEGIFEKYLPYAILFGLTKIWINNMKSIYGDDYFTTHPMYFYVGEAGNIADFDSLNSAISGISNSVSTSTGAGGAGSSGGGGGGGGGGGW